jgi:hypothetical protein
MPGGNRNVIDSPTITWDFSVDAEAKANAVKLDYVQTTNPTLDIPNTVAAGQRWWDVTPGLERIGIRNTANSAWFFYGSQGPQGVQGAQGPQGVQGIQGTPGVQGSDGNSFKWRGAWSNTTAYITDDVVELSGTTYIALQASTNQNPSVGQPSNAFWDEFTISGMQGPQGIQGVQGVQGIQGVPGLSGGIDYIQDTDPTLDDPNTVVALRTWASLAEATFAMLNAANTAWVFFAGGGGSPDFFIVIPGGDFLVDDSGNFIESTIDPPNRVLTDTPTISWDFSTPGQVGGNVI